VERSDDADGVTDTADPAETGRTTQALTRLLPALERFAEGQAAATFPAYRPGTVASEPIGLPDVGIGLDALVDELGTAVEQGCRIGAPGFLGFITTAATTAGVVAQTAASAAGAQRYLLHAFNALEHTALRWLAELCGIPAEASGVFTSGGSTAQLIALGAARQAAFERHGIDVGADGLPTGIQARVYVSSRGHRTIHRAMAVLGHGRSSVVEIATTPCGQLEPAALADALRWDTARGIVPIATVAVAGATDTGAVDPILDVVGIAQEHGSWVHVDGAYGLVANASPAFAPQFRGVERADSWIVDPHKWLATGVGVGAAYVRDGEVLSRAFMEGEAAYLEGSFAAASADGHSQFDLMGGRWADQSLELSAPSRGVLVWAVLREIGRHGVAARVERDAGFATHVAERVRHEDRLELLCDAQLSIVCFRYAPPEGADGDRINRRILERLRQETTVIPTSTVVDGVLAIRPCFINPRTTRHEVDELVDAVLRLGDEVAADA
jgi:aromatic-L-amino-acid/L-tryptophan decarboxylase